jgi:hypothetical protein
MTSTETAGRKSVNQLSVIDGLHDELLIQSADGSEVRLTGCRFGSVGDCFTSAYIQMAKNARWEVPEVEGQAEGRFRRDAEVQVGKSFGMLFYYHESDRSVWINFGRVAAILVWPFRSTGTSGIIGLLGSGG